MNLGDMAVAELQTRSRVVDVDLLLPDLAQGNPWQQSAGMWADDLDWEVFQGANAAYGREIDDQAQSA